MQTDINKYIPKNVSARAYHQMKQAKTTQVNDMVRRSNNIQNIPNNQEYRYQVQEETTNHKQDDPRAELPPRDISARRYHQILQAQYAQKMNLKRQQENVNSDEIAAPKKIKASEYESDEVRNIIQTQVNSKILRQNNALFFNNPVYPSLGAPNVFMGEAASEYQPIQRTPEEMNALFPQDFQDLNIIRENIVRNNVVPNTIEAKMQSILQNPDLASLGEDTLNMLNRISTLQNSETNYINATFANSHYDSFAIDENGLPIVKNINLIDPFRIDNDLPILPPIPPTLPELLIEGNDNLIANIPSPVSVEYSGKDYNVNIKQKNIYTNETFSFNNGIESFEKINTVSDPNILYANKTENKSFNFEFMWNNIYLKTEDFLHNTSSTLQVNKSLLHLPLTTYTISQIETENDQSKKIKCVLDGYKNLKEIKAEIYGINARLDATSGEVSIDIGNKSFKKIEGNNSIKGSDNNYHKIDFKLLFNPNVDTSTVSLDKSVEINSRRNSYNQIIENIFNENNGNGFKIGEPNNPELFGNLPLENIIDYNANGSRIEYQIKNISTGEIEYQCYNEDNKLVFAYKNQLNENGQYTETMCQYHNDLEIPEITCNQTLQDGEVLKVDTNFYDRNSNFVNNEQSDNVPDKILNEVLINTNSTIDREKFDEIYNKLQHAKHTTPPISLCNLIDV